MPRAAKPTQMLLVAGLATLLGVGALGWWVQVQRLDHLAVEKRKGLKKLQVGDQVPPNQEVVDYFTTRTDALARRYEDALKRLTAGSVTSLVSGQGDPQLYFQQRLYEARGVLERTAKARGMEPPTLLGLPKELPPPDAVPRFLAQVGLMQEAGERIMALKGVTQVVSLKAEDPQELDAIQKGDEPFLMRVPVRVRVQGSIETMATLMALWTRAAPIVEVRELHVSATPVQQTLELECVLTQYLVTKPDLEPFKGGEEDAAPRKRARSS